MEFEELLQTKTAGRLLEGTELAGGVPGRDRALHQDHPAPPARGALGHRGPDGPEGRRAAPRHHPRGGAGLRSGGGVQRGFHLAIDVDLVFGKSAYLFVKLSRVVGRLRFVLTRVPFTHWFFSFVEDLLIDF